VPRNDDLFAIFPDLPRMRHSSPEEQVTQAGRQVEDIRPRASENILSQRAAAERVRAATAGRFRKRAKGKVRNLTLARRG